MVKKVDINTLLERIESLESRLDKLDPVEGILSILFVTIFNTSDLDKPEALPRISIDEPTMSMLFTINNSPFFGIPTTPSATCLPTGNNVMMNLVSKTKMGVSLDTFFR